MEKVQVGFRILKRILIFSVLVTRYLANAFFIYYGPGDYLDKRRRLIKNSSFYTGRICKAFDINIKIINPLKPGQVGLIVGNHLGFVDILAVNSIAPALFVTSKEMRQTPFLGLLTECAGCIYVDRKNRNNILKELKELIVALQQGFPIVIYPEATSHNGEEVLPFKRTLMTSAAHAKAPIMPYCFNYTSVDGEPFSLKNRDSVCWYGDQSFVESAIRLFRLKYVNVEIEFLPLIYPHPDDDRGQIADLARTSIVNKFIPVIEKRNL